MKRPIPERIEILEKCVQAIWRELKDDADYIDAADYLERAEDNLCSARRALEPAYGGKTER